MSELWQCLWKTSLATLLAWVVAGFLRQRSAAVRHAVWVGGLAAFLLVPAFLPVARRSLVVVPVEPRLPVAMQVVTVVPAQSPATRAFPWRSAAFALWIAGLLWIVSQRLLAAAKLRGISRRAVRVGEFRLSDEVRTPLTWGVLKPVILLPRPALEWTPACLESVLAHEREHIRRRDGLSHWFAEMICAAWWFHPLVWLVRNRAAHERECACDDAVLRSGVRPSDYASELLNLATNMPKRGDPIMALSALSDFERRIRNLLLPGLDRRPANGRARLAVTLATSLLILPLAMLHAQAPAGQGDLSGIVVDASGSRVPNARITAFGSSGNREVTRADAAGEWTLAGVPAGDYRIEVASPGFKLTNKTISLAAGQHTRADLALDLGSVQETIEVVGQGQPRTVVPATGTAERIRVGGNVQATRLIRQVKPAYPEVAKAAGIEGAVLLNAVIGKDGNLLSVTVANKLADPDLAAAALNAVKQWKYQPTLLNGEPVEVMTTVTVNFRLQL